MIISRTGYRLPNPFVDNAKPGPGATWATIGGSIHMVTIRMTTDPPVTNMRGQKLYMYEARLEGAGPCAYGRGPSEAVARLDQVLSF